MTLIIVHKNVYGALIILGRFNRLSVTTMGNVQYRNWIGPVSPISDPAKKAGSAPIPIQNIGSVHPYPRS